MEKSSLATNPSAVSPSGRWYVEWHAPKKNASLALYALMLFDNTAQKNLGIIARFPWNNAPRFISENTIVFAGDSRMFEIRLNGSGKVIASGTHKD